MPRYVVKGRIAFTSYVEFTETFDASSPAVAKVAALIFLNDRGGRVIVEHCDLEGDHGQDRFEGCEGRSA